MTILEMLEQSGVLTVLGVAVVFAFLFVMIVCVNLTGKIIRFFEPPSPGMQQCGAVGPAAAGIYPGIIAAISVAVNGYRKS